MTSFRTMIAAAATFGATVAASTSSYAGTVKVTSKASTVMLNPQPLPPGCHCDKGSVAAQALKVQAVRRR